MNAHCIGPSRSSAKHLCHSVRYCVSVSNDQDTEETEKATVRRDWRIPGAPWERIQPLSPARKTHPLGCHRPGVPDRAAVDAIFFVLRTGMRRGALNVTGICPGAGRGSAVDQGGGGLQGASPCRGTSAQSDDPVPSVANSLGKESSELAGTASSRLCFHHI